MLLRDRGLNSLVVAFLYLLLSKLFEAVLSTINETHALRADPEIPYECPIPGSLAVPIKGN
jgi:hypothetical protein